MQKRLLAALALVALSACGTPDTPKYHPQILPRAYGYHGPGSYDGSVGEIAFPGNPPTSGSTPPDLTPDQRAKYCAVYIDAEPDETVKNKVLSDLSATWKRDIGAVGFPPFGLNFTFDRHGKAGLSGAIFEPDESITFNAAFVSKPMVGTRYDGYRVIELPANNNEGVAAFAVKFMDPAQGRSNPTLFMTARKYWRYGQSDTIRTPDQIFAHDNDQEQTVRLWVYPIKG